MTAIVPAMNVLTIAINKSLATGIAPMIEIATTSGDSGIQIAIAIGMTLDSGKVTSLTATCAGMRMLHRLNSSVALDRRRVAGATL